MREYNIYIIYIYIYQYSIFRIIAFALIYFKISKSMTNRARQVSSIRELIIFMLLPDLGRPIYSRKYRWALFVWSISSSRMYVEERIESLVSRKWFVVVKSIQIMILDYRDHKFMIGTSLFDREAEMKRTMTWWGQVVDNIRYREEERWISRKREKKEDVRVTMIRLRKRKTRIAADKLFESQIPISSYRIFFIIIHSSFTESLKI